MSDVIQCPQCDKKFRLPAQVPATFTCTNCGTVMDLSDFGGAAVEATAPSGAAQTGGAPQSRRSRAKGRSSGGGRRREASAAPASSAPASAAPASTRSARSGGRRGRSAGRASGGRASGGRGGAAPEEEYDDEPRGYRGRQKKSNAPIIIGSVAALMVAVVLVVISMKKGDDAPEGGPGTNTASGATPGAGTSGTPAGGARPAASNPGSAPTAGSPGASAGGSPGAAATSGGDGTSGAEPAKKPRSSGKGRYKRMSKVKLEIFPWPEDIDAETRAKAEEGIKAMYSGGRDWDDAQEWFVAQGRPICGRLISELKTIQDTTGLDNPEGKSYVGAVDSCLRKIDGWMERKWKELDAVRHSSHPNKVIGSCRRWTWWWKYDEWQNNPRDPWDPFEDESDDTDTGIKAPDKKKPKKGKGFGTRAGGG